MAADISPAETALPISTAAVTITEAEFIAEGGTVTETCPFMITYQDAVTGTFCDDAAPLTVTRTFSIADACNTTMCTQVFAIMDLSLIHI